MKQSALLVSGFPNAHRPCINLSSSTDININHFNQATTARPRHLPVQLLQSLRKPPASEDLLLLWSSSSFPSSLVGHWREPKRCPRPLSLSQTVAALVLRLGLGALKTAPPCHKIYPQRSARWSARQTNPNKYSCVFDIQIFNSALMQ